MEESSEEKKSCILIGCTGSVASMKLPELVKAVLESTEDVEVKIVVTDHAQHFFRCEDLPEEVTTLSDSDEWAAWRGRGDPVLHIDLAKWADIFVIAPLDANTLAKVAQGLCDNLLTCICRAWDVHKPLLFCPAMNTKMWDHPVTSAQVATLKSWGYVEVPCISKTLMCGDTGLGAMAEVAVITQKVLTELKKYKQSVSESQDTP